MDTVTPESAQKLLDLAAGQYAAMQAHPCRATCLSLLQTCELLEEELLILAAGVE